MLVINTYIIEDESDYRKKIVRALENYHSEFIQFKISSMDNYLLFMNDLQHLTISDTDLFIFDIDLKTSFTGIDLAIEVRKKNKKCPIIFMTSLEDKAISIINSSIYPIGYIVKQMLSIDLTKPMRQLLATVEFQLLESWRMDPEIIVINHGAEKLYINAKDILYIEALKEMRGHVLIKTFSKDIILKNQIGKLKKSIYQPYLLTSLQSYIINLSSITTLDRTNGVITFSNNQTLLVGIKIIDKIKKAYRSL